MLLVTGARVKVGFQVAVKLLRCGATVLATSRFAADAATRFAALPDAPSWQGRLHVYGIDLRDLAAIERLCAHLLVRCERLDAIINNAAQTIRRPAAYYAHLIPAEMALGAQRPAEVQALLADNEACFAQLAAPAPAPAPAPPLQGPAPAGLEGGEAH